MCECCCYFNSGLQSAGTNKPLGNNSLGRTVSTPNKITSDVDIFKVTENKFRNKMPLSSAEATSHSLNQYLIKYNCIVNVFKQFCLYVAYSN